MMMMKPPSTTPVYAANPTNNRFQKPLLHPPSYIVYNDIRFLIIDTPSVSNMSRYIKEFEHWNVTDVVRCCKATYSQSILNERGIQVHDWLFSDGDPPSKNIIDAWLHLIDARFKRQQHHQLEKMDDDDDDEEKKIQQDCSDDEMVVVATDKKRPCIAAHCVAGLGRAPVLVAIALIEEGMDPLDSIAFIRKHRKGAINHRQLKYLETYKRRRWRNSSSNCVIS